MGSPWLAGPAAWEPGYVRFGLGWPSRAGAPGPGPLAWLAWAMHACIEVAILGTFRGSARTNGYTPGVGMHSGFVSLTSAYVTPPPVPM